MAQLFRTPAYLTMKVSCYHYDYDLRREEGDKIAHTRVETHRASEPFSYISWRDISGNYVLDTSRAMMNQNQAFVKLNLTMDLQFAQDGTLYDYENQKQILISRNRYDSYQDYTESIVMDGFNEHTLVRVSDFDPPLFGWRWYTFFTLLTFAELYKMYMNLYCVSQSFRIVKVVSSRKDLQAGESIPQEYKDFVPRIEFMGDVRTFQDSAGKMNNRKTEENKDTTITDPLLIDINK